jgi:hypothetical protein
VTSCVTGVYERTSARARGTANRIAGAVMRSADLERSDPPPVRRNGWSGSDGEHDLDSTKRAHDVLHPKLVDFADDAKSPNNGAPAQSLVGMITLADGASPAPGAELPHISDPLCQKQ